MRTADVYKDGVGNVCFDIGDLHLEYHDPVGFEINSVLEYDETGYVRLDTDHGPEVYRFDKELKESELDDTYNIKHIMNDIGNWVIKRESKVECEALKQWAIYTSNGLAFGVAKYNGYNALRVIDIEHQDQVANFMWSIYNKKFTLMTSTFKDKKKKYLMLYIVEKNTEDLKNLSKI